MKEASVISVNPGKKTLGELCIGSTRVAAVSRTIASAPTSGISLRSALQAFFGISRKGTMNGRLALMRVAAAGCMAALAYPAIAASGLDFSMAEVAPAIMIAISASLLSGLFTRAAGLVGMIWFGYNCAIAMIAGGQFAMPMLAAFISTMAFVMGPGKISADGLMMRMILKSSKKRKSSRKGGSEIAMSYRAFEMADRV